MHASQSPIPRPPAKKRQSRKATRPPKAERTMQHVPNWEIFIWALQLLGGATRFVDVEDVFLKCNDLAPTRFSWRTRQDIPEYKKCAKALRDAETRNPSLTVKKAKDPFKRQLSVEGQAWIKQNHQRLEKSLAVKTTTALHTKGTKKVITEILRSKQFKVWKSAPSIKLESWQIADLLHCSPASPIAIRISRLQHLRSVAQALNAQDVIEFLNHLLEDHNDWFSGV
jgi:hypothetical protein